MQGPRNAVHAGEEGRGAQACDALTDLANELQRTAQCSGGVGLDARNERRGLECCGGMKVWRHAGMDGLENWRFGSGPRRDLDSHPIFRERTAGCIPDAVVPTTRFYLLPARWPGTRASCRDVRPSTGAQPAPGPWRGPGKLPHQVTHPTPCLGLAVGPLSVQLRNQPSQPKHSERQPLRCPPDAGSCSCGRGLVETYETVSGLCAEEVSAIF